MATVQGYAMSHEASQKPYQHDVPPKFHGVSVVFTIKHKNAALRAAKVEAKMDELSIEGSPVIDSVSEPIVARKTSKSKEVPAASEGGAVVQNQEKRGRKKKSPEAQIVQQA
jgi:hypothetical protein